MTKYVANYQPNFHQDYACMIIISDDTVWLANGLPGIVLGTTDAVLEVLWHTGRVTKLPRSLVAYAQRCPPGLTAPPLWGAV